MLKWEMQGMARVYRGEPVRKDLHEEGLNLSPPRAEPEAGICV